MTAGTARRARRPRPLPPGERGIDRAPKLGSREAYAKQAIRDKLMEHKEYSARYGDHNGFTHQDPGFIEIIMNKSPDVCRVYMPPDAHCLLNVAHNCLRSCNYFNVIVSDKQKHLQYTTMEQAIQQCTKGLGIWPQASNDLGNHPDVVMACASCPAPCSRGREGSSGWSTGRRALR